MLHDNQKHPTHGPPPPGSPSGESLADIGKRLRRSMTQAGIGMTLVAIEVMKLAEHWENYKDQAGGLEIGRWLLKEVDPTVSLRQYIELAKAAKRAGTMAHRMYSNLLLWLHHAIPPSGPESEKKFQECLRIISRVYKKDNGFRPVKKTQGVRLCARFTARRRTRARSEDIIRELRARIERLEAQVRRLGEEPVA
jgi:hypothetical protein